MEIRTQKYHAAQLVLNPRSKQHALALSALKLGESSGFQGPALRVERLFCAGVILAAKKVIGRNGPVWRLSYMNEKKFKRKWIPAGPYSIVQKRLKISERVVVVPAQRHLSKTGSLLPFP